MLRGISLSGLFLVFGLAFADAARAEIVIEASLGQGMQLSPRPSGAAQATSLMVAPGYIFFDTVRLELGLVAAVDAIKGGAFDLEIRPMIVVAPEFVPFYGRLVFGIVQLVTGAELAIGGTVGIGGLLNEIGLFAEAGMLPRAGKAKSGNDHMRWIVEARVGAYYLF